eukprot:TRINITY_DN15683_c0_g1_i4.p1 TRINITY_DN15683_c0_g1~~TRINITY_DN15683_c0_g1_i4.p1  ORF type:complete len:239 (-),score=62.60 TRINITY_DN15683_c0_g1_i4:347-1036(-)
MAEEQHEEQLAVEEEEEDVDVDVEEEDDEGSSEDDSCSDEEKHGDAELPAQPKYGCQHYRRRCELLAPCCNNWVGCRFCHNDGNVMDKRTGKKCKVQEMDRAAVKVIRCLLCKTEQPPTPKCAHCGVEFARYFCAKCVFYDDDPAKEFWHCDPCGLCRVAATGHKPSEYVHCPKCGGCWLPDSHKCVFQDVLSNNCPICCELLLTSRLPATLLPCGHRFKLVAVFSGCF